MLTMLHRSSLHVANLSNLLWLRSLCNAHPGTACHLFSIDGDLVRLHAQLADHQVDELCAELDVALLIPRFDRAGLQAALLKAAAGLTPSLRSDLAINNLRNLERLCEACRDSAGHAVWTFHISQDAAEAYRTLDDHQLVALCRFLDTSAFIPRYSAAQLTTLLDKPPGMRAVYAAACEDDMAVDSPAAHRNRFLAH